MLRFVGFEIGIGLMLAAFVAFVALTCTAVASDNGLPNAAAAAALTQPGPSTRVAAMRADAGRASASFAFARRRCAPARSRAPASVRV